METIAGREIRTTIALDGEQAFRRSLQSLDRELNVMRAELNTLSSTYNENAESVEALAERQNLMQGIITNNERRFRALGTAVNDSNERYQQAVRHLEEMQRQFGDNSRQAVNAANAVRRAEEQLDRYRVQLANSEEQLNRSRRALENFNEQFNNEETEDIEETTETIEDLEEVLEETRNKLEEFREKMSELAETTKKRLSTFKDVTTTIGSIGLKATKLSFKPAIASLEAFAKTSTSAISIATKAVAGYATAITGAGVAMLATVEETKEYRADLARLETASEMAGNSFDVMKEQMFEISALTGEADASIEALNNLIATELTDNQIVEALEAMSGAIIKFPDTLKIEALADGLQETIATGAGAGTFAELIERLGYNLDDFNAGLANCVDWTERQNYALEWLADTGLAKISQEYKEVNAETLNYEEQQLRLSDATAKLGETFEPLKSTITGYGADFLNILADMVSGTDTSTDALSEKIDEFVNDITKGTTTYLPKFTNLVTDVIEAVGDSLSKNLPKIVDEALPPLIKSTENLAKSIIKTLPTFAPKIVESGVKLLSGLLTSINEVLDELLPILPGLIEDIGDVLIENAPTILNSSIEMFGKIAEGVTSSTETILAKLPELVNSIADTLLNGTTADGKSNIQMMIDTGYNLLTKVIDGLTNSDFLSTDLPLLIEDIVEELTNAENIKKMFESGKKLATELCKGLPEATEAIITGVLEVCELLGEEFLKFDWLIIGTQILGAILDGMSQALNPLVKDRNEKGLDFSSDVTQNNVTSAFSGMENELFSAFSKYANVESQISTQSNTNNVSTTYNYPTTNITIQNANMSSEKDIDALAEAFNRKQQMQNSAIGRIETRK